VLNFIRLAVILFFMRIRRWKIKLQLGNRVYRIRRASIML